MEALLRGVDIPKPTYSLSKLPTALTQLTHYTQLRTYFPSMKTLFSLEETSGQEVWFDNDCRITHINIVNEEHIKGNCKIQVLYKTDSKKIDAYLKVTHLIDPVTYVKKCNDAFDYNTDPVMKAKIDDPWNQAYVETLASYCLGKLRQENISPHFNFFYGAFRSVAKKYSYNISDDIESYRLYKWFWNGIEKHIMKIEIDVEDEEERKEIYDEIMKKPDHCLEEDEEEDDIELLEADGNLDAGELHSLDSVSIRTHKSSSTHSQESSEESSQESSEEGDEIKVYLNVENFPVMMIFTEKNESTMDDLLEDYDEVGAEPGEKLWEEKWTAWLFQVMSALCVAQTLFGFTHNDLHSSNIVWSSTEKTHIYYKSANNKLFKVPTYGKIFKIIDFGRSIFSINEHIFISDDFKEGNDAATQYSFPPLIEEPEKVYPNPSFDLARLSISIFESLFPDVLQDEKGQIKTTSDLCNLLWAWLIDCEGKNILWDDDNEERFPDFELYVHIAAKCKNAIPKEQIYKKPFLKFLVNSVPKNAHVYSLYV